MDGRDVRQVQPDGLLPIVLGPNGDGDDLVQRIAGAREELNAALFDAGGVLLRGFGPISNAIFSQCVSAFGQERMAYTYRSTPRTEVGDRIFTTTEYPNSQVIPLHSENSYQREWPLTLMFCCVTPALRGGETPIADLVSVTKTIDPAIIEMFRARGVKYVRHYFPHLDISWQSAFNAATPEAVDSYCRARGIETEWLADGVLRTSQLCQGTAHHPLLKELVIFNQAHLFHPSALAVDDREALEDLYGADRMPRTACWGDGEIIAAEILDQVRAAFEGAKRSFPWQAGDVLILDNMRVAHGRSPYEGPRHHLAALLDPFRNEDLPQI